MHRFAAHSIRAGIQFFVCVAWCCCASFSCSISSDENASEPAVYCSNPVWDVGGVDPTLSTLPSHSFLVQNTTPSRVAIRVKPSCGCIATQPPNSIPAHGSALIDTQLRLSPLENGPFEKTIAVSVTSARNGQTEREPQRITLRVHGTVNASGALMSLPKTINFGELAAGVAKVREVCVSRVDGSPILFQGAHCTVPGVEVESELRDGGRTVSIRARIAFDGKPASPDSSPSRGFLVVSTGHQVFPVLHVPLEFHLLSRAGCFRKHVVMTSIQPGESRVTSLLRTGASPDSVKDYEVVRLGSTDGLSVSLSNRQAFELDVAVLRHIRSGQLLKSEVVLQESAISDQIVVPLLVHVQ